MFSDTLITKSQLKIFLEEVKSEEQGSLLELLGEEKSPISQGNLEKEHAKFIAHIKAWSGYISIEGSLKDLKQYGSNCRFISEGDVLELERWSQQQFLFLQSMCLLELYSEETQKKAKELFLRELLIAINAYRLLKKYSSFFKSSLSSSSSSSSKDEMNAWLGEIVDVISHAKPDEFGSEICFPCGTRDHAIYLYLFKIPSQDSKLFLRIDNLTSKDDGVEKLHLSVKKPDGTKKRYPFVRYINFQLDENDARDILRKYLKKLIRIYYSASPWGCQDVINGIYKKDLMSLDGDFEPTGGYFPLEVQKINNCVYASYSAGIKYRLFR